MFGTYNAISWGQVGPVSCHTFNCVSGPPTMLITDFGAARACTKHCQLMFGKQVTINSSFKISIYDYIIA